MPAVSPSAGSPPSEEPNLASTTGRTTPGASSPASPDAAATPATAIAQPATAHVAPATTTAAPAAPVAHHNAAPVATSPAPKAAAPDTAARTDERRGKLIPIDDDDYGGIDWSAAEAPRLGASAPSFELPAADGTRFRSADAITAGTLVVVFYRGYW
ncbi:MAG: hypothetical protein B7733_24205 [Myxococcales bacterium FL481]|nr:MAG: hypothetical protein B7733_24205 [Myxococcales bacterium FL481]